MPEQSNNICRFVTGGHTPDVIQTVHFVYETHLHGDGVSRMAMTARIHFVTAGTATVRCGGCTREVTRGDVFFLLPAVNYAITGSDDFCYMYISFIGLRAGILLERLHVSSSNFVFPGFAALEPVWRQAISLPGELMDLASESVLLYTLAHIGQPGSTAGSPVVSAAAEKMLLVKKHIDDHFADSRLSLDSLSKIFSYSPKYLSAAFKKHFSLGISEYLTTVRIHYACRLIEEKYTGVADIASLCGFSDSMYFSKVFKRHIGCSPKAYMRNFND